MVRAVNDKYNVWIAGYYDDFTGARAVPQDMNTPNTDNDYLHYLSHFGNPLNGEARLNPRYRWCIMDRVYDNSTLPSTTFFTSSTYKLLHNKGMFEWLGYDPIRNYSYTEQGRSTLEYPDGHTNANKFRTSPTATTGTYGADAFQMFCNGHDSSGYYVVPTGSIDASYARNSMIGFNDNTKFEAKETGLNNISGSTNITTVTRAHLAGRWVGETINYSSGTNDTAPENIFAEVKSPSGQPFLCVQQYGKTGHDSTLYTNPTIFYNGNLNSRDTGDYLSFRICVRSFNGATTNDGKVTPRVHIKAGFPKTNGGITSTTLSSGDSYGANTHYEEGLIGTPAIAFNLDLTGYDTHPMLYSSSTTASTIPTTDEMWIDVDIHLDYDSGTKVYKVYQDGVLKSTNNFATDRVADEMYGWEIYTRSPAGSDNTTTTIMLDRAALYRPLTDDPSGVELNPMQKLSFSMPNNGISMATLEFEDEPVLNEVDYQVGFVNTTYDFQVTEIFNGSLYQEWYMLVFAGAGETGAKDIARIDRPIWKGMISNVSVKESLQRKRILTIEAQDNLALLDKQLPLWESGQGGTNDNQAGSLYWKYEAEGMKELMNMGASSLKTLAGNLGRDSNSSYQNRDNQRTQLHSAHPIQLYNNEDTYGPNSVENEFEGMGIDYIRHNADGTLTFVMTGNPVFIDNSEVTIDHTGISSWDGATLDIESVDVIDGKQEITFLGDTTQDLPSNQLLNDINTYSGHNIVYAGKYIGKSISYDDINYKTRNEFVSSANYHYLRDFPEWRNWATLVDQNPSGNTVKEILVTNQGENYTYENYYKNSAGQKRGTLDLANHSTTLTDEWGNVYSRNARADWISDQEGKIIEVEVLDEGRGYNTFTINNSDIIGTAGYNHYGVKDFTITTDMSSLTTVSTGFQICESLNADGDRGDPDSAEFGLVGAIGCTYSSGARSITVPLATGGTGDALFNGGGLEVGMKVTGQGIPAGASIVSIDSATTLTISADLTANNATEGRVCFIKIVKPGANYATSGGNYAQTSNFTVLQADGTFLTINFTVTAVSTDAAFEVILGGEEETNYYTFCFDSDPNLIFGDEFVISNTGTSGNANRYQAIAGKHKVKKIKKVFNYHDSARNTRTSVLPTGGTDYLWQVQTYTPYSGTEFGTWNNNNGLLTATDNDDSADEKIKWLKVNRGIMKPAPTTEDVSSRVTHAVWMRDMPKSLWFQYHFGQIKSTPLISWDNYTAISANASSIEITSATYNNASLPNSGVGEIVRPADSAHAQTRLDIRDFFTYKFKYTTSGPTKYFLGGVQYISMAHPTVKLGWTGFTSHITSPVKVNILDIDTNYKHMWLLWADMRNDGTADADGSTRKTSFGLLNPRSKNYNVNMLFENQFDENGNPSIFAELKNNDDIDMWEIDSTRDDTTGIPFSYPVDYANQKFATVADSSGNLVVTTKDASGSAIAHGLSVGDYVYIMNSQDAKHDGKHQIASKTTNTFTITGAFVSADSAENGSFLVVAQCIGSASDLAVYKDWETKGGCLLAIDTSKFFNLNTLANNGHSGKDGGGRTDLSDYYAVSKGDVALIDNYYMYAPSTVLSTDTNYGKHINQEKIVSSSCELTGDISKGQFYLTPSDVTMFNDNGAGRIVGYKDEARTELYYAWDGKLDTAITGTLDSMTVTATDGHWVLTDSGAFTNAKVGMYITNTSKPLVAGVGNSWKTTHIQTSWYRIKEVTNANSIKVERVAYLPYSLRTSDRTYLNVSTGTGTSGEHFTNFAQGLRSIVTLTQNMLDDGWASNSNYEIPAQLGNVIIESATSITTDTTYSVAEIENGFVNIATELNILRGDVINYSKVDLVNSNYTEVETFTNLSPQYAYRLMMNIDGEVETPNNGTFYHSDKFRTLWSAGLLDSWWLNTRLSCMFDINNIPITNMMTTYDSVSSNDEYGSIYNAKGKTLFNTIKGIQKQSGQGRINSLETSFSYLMGRDNRIEFRPKYNSGISLDRNNVKVSQMNLNAGSIIENVRVYYNNNNNFVDYPSASLNDTTRWKIISNDDIFSDVEANRLAKETYRKNKQQSLKMSVQPIRAIGDTDIMLDGGRYGYICDAHVALQGHDDNSKASAWCWTRYGTGGVLFPGMVNALDGNLGSTITSSTLYTRQGDSGTPTYSATLPITDNYYWYGSKSVSRAVQIVHVSKDTPKSHASGELRIFVALKADQAAQSDVENLQFTVYIPHYSFATTAGTPSDVAPTRAATLLSVSSQDVKHSGFYELDVPSSYGTGKIVFSFNAEYCRDLVRSRCGSSNTHKNAHDVTGIDLGSSFNTDSIFPLGMRQYDEFKGGLGSQRTEYYAPTINIVNDLTYVPATYVTYTDAGHDLSSQVLVIQNVDWSVSAGDVEQVTLELDRDESVQAGGVVPYIMERLPHVQPTHGPTYTLPLPVSVTEEIETLDTLPINGNDTGSGFDSSDDNSQGTKINDMTRGVYNTMKGKMGMKGSEFSSQSTFAILGQNKPPTTPSNMRGMFGNLRAPVNSGSALENPNSFSLPGKGKTKAVDSPSNKRDIRHSVELELTTPNDAITDEINITATLDMKPTNQDNTGVLYIEATCRETGDTIRETVKIKAGTYNNHTLVSTQLLSGVKTAGNNLVISVGREAGSGSDNADYQAIRVKNLHVNFRRAAFNSENAGNSFIPYS